MKRYLAVLLSAVLLLPTIAAKSTSWARELPGKPNIILILTDDQSMESVARMPYVARQPWMRFSRAFIENALCCPSRATILSGRYDTHTGVINNRTGNRFNEANALPVWLQRGGYLTALIGKYLNNYPFSRGNYVPAGWSQWYVPMGPSLYNQFNYRLNDNGTVRTFGSSAASYQVDVLRARAVRTISTAPPGKPLFLMFAPTSTHSPWVPAPRHTGHFSGTTMPHYPNQSESDVSDKPRWVRELQPTDLRLQDSDRRKEWTAALAIDDAVRAIDDALAARGTLSHTVEIFMTDNGYSFGAHRFGGKRCEYEECTQTPFLVRYPGQRARQDTHLVSNVDIAATFADLAGVSPGLPQDGRSLKPLFQGRAGAWRTGVLQHWSGGDAIGEDGIEPIPAFYAIRTSRYRYVELATGETEMYDLRQDPYELANLAGQPRSATLQAQLREQLRRLEAGA